ncbi:MAG: flagellar hook-length control protein FliK [Gemmataceae bacterium]|nr:flagellar hook-length control protein FliK [Gemmataceae bacterium]
MHVTPLEPTVPGAAPPGGVTTVRILAGQLTAVPVGELLRATVTRVSPGEAVLTVNGQALTVRPAAGLQPGAAILVRVPGGAAPSSLELVGRAPTPAAAAGPPATPAQPPGAGPTPVRTSQIALVDVLPARAGGQTEVAASAPPPAGVTTVRILAGQLPAVPAGELLRATVARVSPGEAVLTVNGQALTVRPAAGLQPGAAILVRVPGGAAPSSLELVGRAPTPAVQPAATSPPTTPTQPAEAGGQIRVLVNGQHEVAVSTTPLMPGGRYVLQVEQTPTGLVLRPPPDSPSLAADVATAVLRGSRPADLGAALKPLLAELAALQQERTGPVGQAAASVREAVRAFLPADDRPPNPTQLQNLVENGGLHYEAKLARQATGPTGDGGDAPPPPPGHSATASSNPTSGPDLKESLLRLLHAAQEIGTAAALPAAQAALNGVESQQAANVVAQAQGTPYVLQVPFPDGGQWRTLNLAVEPERNGRSGSGPGSGFRLLMHVPLAGLGETWIDAGLSENRFRAVLYLDNAAARDRVRAELPDLRTELLTGGFSEALLDVRPADALPTRRRMQAAAMQAGRPAGVSVLDVRA